MRTSRTLCVALLVSASVVLLASTRPVPPVELTYLGNEGVLLTAGDQQVAIDALHREFPRPPHYAHLPEPHRSQLERAQPPFDRIRVHLTTHVHADHFHAESVARFLAEGRKADLVVPPEALAEVCRAQGAGACKPAPRLHAVTLARGGERELVFGKVRVTVLDLPHAEGARTMVTNLGYLVTIDGARVLHVGDAHVSAAAFARFRLKERHIDAALVPYWYLMSEEGRTLVRDHIGARQVVAFHVPPGEADTAAEQLRQHVPGIRVLTRLMQTERLGVSP